MIAVDTNVLVYAHVDTFSKHELAKNTLMRLAAGRRRWGLPAPCLVEFLRIVTHPKVLADPYSVDEALEALDTLLQAPTVSVLCPGDQHWTYLRVAAAEANTRGNLAFDAAIAAICREVGVIELFTEDRDFDRFDDLKIARLGDHE